jgi:hypothetical protein
MSGGKEETMATFMNNIEYIKDNEYEQNLSKEIVNNFKFFNSGTILGRISTAIKKNEDVVISNTNIAHKKTMALLNDLFNCNKEFKFNFIKEAMTGIKKFGRNSKGSCTHLLTVSKDGKFCHLANIDDEEYIKTISDNTKISVRFKSTSVKRQNEKTGEYRYWSVLGLITNNLSNKKRN